MPPRASHKALVLDRFNLRPGKAPKSLNTWMALLKSSWKSIPGIFWVAVCSRMSSIAQFRYIQIQPNTIDLSTKLWEINPTSSVVIPQSLVMRSIDLSWILIYRNRSINLIFWPIYQVLMNQHFYERVNIILILPLEFHKCLFLSKIWKRENKTKQSNQKSSLLTVFHIKYQNRENNSNKNRVGNRTQRRLCLFKVFGMCRHNVSSFVNRLI